MVLNADDYRLAASARIETARMLYDLRRYGASIYLVGVAVECILRAYRLRLDPQFDAAHDLAALLKQSGLVSFVPAKRRVELSASLGEVWSRWRNGYRYAPDARVRADLHDRDLLFGIKGDSLKENARVTLENGYNIVNLGVARWKNT